MDYTERSELEFIIEVIKDWEPEQHPIKIEDAFIRLQEINQYDNFDLWGELKKVLSNNKNLSHPVLSTNISDDLCANYVHQGYFWYNKSMWGTDT